MPDFTATFNKPFKEQVAAFALRLGNLVPTERWDDIWQEAHDRAFMVAGATKADLLADLAEAVGKSISEGTGLEEFRRDFRAIVEKRGWHGWTGEGTKAGEAWRTRVIYRTNARTSYGAGRFAQLTEGGFAYWVYFHGGSAHPREIHRDVWNGLVLPPDHPFWAEHYPPNGWGCSCYVSGARSHAAARRLGGDPDKRLPANWRALDPKTGAPQGIDKGWAYAPGASVADTVSIAAPMIARLPALLGSAAGVAMSSLVDKAWPVWVADVLSRGRHVPGLAGVLAREEIEALHKIDVKLWSAEILVHPGVLSGRKARRHMGRGDALSEDEWLLLPTRLRDPIAVLRDNQTGKLLYVLKGMERHSQLAVEINRSKKYGREAFSGNTVMSAYHPNLRELLRRVADGKLTLLRGKLE